eukprot:gene35329-52801_t
MVMVHPSQYHTTGHQKLPNFNISVFFWAHLAAFAVAAGARAAGGAVFVAIAAGDRCIFARPLTPCICAALALVVLSPAIPFEFRKHLAVPHPLIPSAACCFVRARACGVGVMAGGGGSREEAGHFAEVALLVTDTAAALLRRLFRRAYAGAAGAEWPAGTRLSRRDGAEVYAHTASTYARPLSEWDTAALCHAVVDCEPACAGLRALPHGEEAEGVVRRLRNAVVAHAARGRIGADAAAAARRTVARLRHLTPGTRYALRRLRETLRARQLDRDAKLNARHARTAAVRAECAAEAALCQYGLLSGCTTLHAALIAGGLPLPRAATGGDGASDACSAAGTVGSGTGTVGSGSGAATTAVAPSVAPYQPRLRAVRVPGDADGICAKRHTDDVLRSCVELALRCAAPLTIVVGDWEGEHRVPVVRSGGAPVSRASKVALKGRAVADLADEAGRQSGFLTGAPVEAHSLKSTALNGAIGEVLGAQDGRLQVDFGAAHGRKALLPANLRAASSSGGCGAVFVGPRSGKVLGELLLAAPPVDAPLDDNEMAAALSAAAAAPWFLFDPAAPDADMVASTVESVTIESSDAGGGDGGAAPMSVMARVAGMADIGLDVAAVERGRAHLPVMDDQIAHFLRNGSWDERGTAEFVDTAVKYVEHMRRTNPRRAAITGAAAVSRIEERGNVGPESLVDVFHLHYFTSSAFLDVMHTVPDAMAKAEEAGRSACSIAGRLLPSHQAVAYANLVDRAARAQEERSGRRDEELQIRSLEAEAQLERKCGNIHRAADLQVEIVRLHKADAGGAPHFNVAVALFNAALFYLEAEAMLAEAAAGCRPFPILQRALA